VVVNRTDTRLIPRQHRADTGTGDNERIDHTAEVEIRRRWER
jgi:Arc/MetJ family transcription regulator